MSNFIIFRVELLILFWFVTIPSQYSEIYQKQHLLKQQRYELF